ncbi:hypothetical protein [Pseudofrankia inefficax]|uniref:Uncharacterized protein n=1 Tax=Pseudofrankia inefficax (strain DSM 45817 / CECT 9037 / DDB 130130 / EuI1c) TaxID=298654 RepID=E3J651_PSEI1|nr:hypothetical protein [Pseudofrankia inefficax]ADP78342.1 hypothetical protein FraEuI1c_0256 [Pseudofrankia inefficax]
MADQQPEPGQSPRRRPRFPGDGPPPEGASPAEAREWAEQWLRSYRADRRARRVRAGTVAPTTHAEIRMRLDADEQREHRRTARDKRRQNPPSDGGESAPE